MTDITMDGQTQDRTLGDVLAAHDRILVLSGAGCSTASGLGDYRDKDGNWKRPQPMTGQVFRADEMARRRYWARSFVGWQQFKHATPSPAHSALAALEGTGRLETLITQNVDGLHQQAGHQSVIELHGALRQVHCLDCGETLCRDDFQNALLALNPWLANLTADYAPDGDADLELDSLDHMQLPTCEHCGGVLKPDVVFFGENVPKSRVDDAFAALDNSEALLVVGSSLMVYSGYRFCRHAEASGKPIYLVNDGKTRADHMATEKFSGECGALLAAALEQLAGA